MYYSFKNVSKQNIDTSLIGKKAESLVQMTAWNFPVPDGGCITTRGFDEFIKLNSLQDVIAELSELMKLSGDKTKIDALSETIREKILAGTLPKEIEKEVESLQSNHPDSHFAVRSSGTKEDLAGASFAGQYDTILNVKTAPHLFDAIRTCWASLFNERVITYCMDKKISFGNMKLSVCLQKMIPADKSGVIFTVRPHKGHDKEIFIEACFGIGEALVGGEVTPDQYVYDWFNETEKERTISTKKIAIIAIDEPPFTKTITNSDERANETVLNSEEVRELSKIAVNIQSSYGFPVDIEWVKKDDNFYIIQSRPITAINSSGIEGEWTTADFKDGGVSSTVCTPYMWSLYDLAYEQTMPVYLEKIKLITEGKSILWGDMFFGRPYWNLGEIKNGLRKLPGFCERDFDNDLGIQITYEGDGYRTQTTPKTLFHGIKVLIALKKSFKEQMEFIPQFKKRQEAKLKELEEINPSDMDRESFLRFFEAFIAEEYFNSEGSYFTMIYDNSNINSIFNDKIRSLNVEVNILNLISGLTNLSHLIPNYKLWDLKEEIKKNDVSRRFWQEAPVQSLVEKWRNGDTSHYMDKVRDYITEFKFHSTRELDIMVPRYGEDPSFVMENLKNLLELDDKFEPRALNEKQHKAYIEERKKLLKAVPFYKRRSVAKLLDKRREFLWWREEARDLSTQFYYYVRKFTLELSRHFMDMGYITEKEDIFFLAFDDMKDVIHKRITENESLSIVKRNRTYYDSFRNYQNPNEIGNRFSQSSPVDIGENAEVLTGIPCSQGVVSGKIKVIKDIFDADRLEKGDILITKYTDPGWTPKFGFLAGVATETGGLLSHAAVISREYGIPAVLAIDNLTQILKDGQHITLDGNTGKIYIEEE